MSASNFYVGISECGCISAMLVDDNDTTAKEVADFARRMQRTKRRMQHRIVTPSEREQLFKPCPHQEQQP